MRRTLEGTAAALLASGLLLILTACSDSNGPGGDTLGSDEADDVAVAAVDELEQSVAAYSSEGVVTGTIELGSAGCAEVTGDADSDGDGAPDEATYTFALPACSFTGFRGGTLDITGVITLSDPTPSAPDFAWQADLDDFRWTVTSPDASRSYTAVRNGTRVLSGNAAGLSLTNTVTLVRTFAGRPETTVQHNLIVTFTPDAGESLARGEPLPDGTIDKSGTLIWSRNGRSRTFTVTTVEPLVWDASCTTVWKIASGEIHYTLGDGSYVRSVWTGCGERPERSFVTAP
jgi:hypothetical protein